MSSTSCLLTEEQLLCDVCLNVFTEPVTLPCGHNFCRSCIVDHWETSIQRHCPTCNEPLYGGLDLRVNMFISEMAAHFRQSTRKDGPRFAQPGEVPCDVCSEPKLKALRSCLVCLGSYCESHLKPHLTVSRLKRHQLTDPTDNLERRMCPTHDKPLELFCKTDQTCVCMLCPVMDHKSHDIALLKEQFESKKAELGWREEEIQQMIQERRLMIRDLKHAMKLSRDAAYREIGDGIQVFAALKEILKKAQAELVGTIEERQKTTEKQAKSFIQELEQELSELTRRQAEVEQLWSAKDHLLFLQGFGMLTSSTPTKDWSEVSMNLPSHEGTVRSAMNRLQEKLGAQLEKLVLETELNRVRQFAVDVTLDPNTAHSALLLSDDGKQVHHGARRKNLPDNPQRFDPCCCVLAKQCFSTGRFYFEVQVKDKTRWTLGVAKESIQRKGIVPLCPQNGHWGVWLKNRDQYAALVGSPLPLSAGSKPQKVGVFVDYDKGLVSFYNVDTAAVLYSFTSCTFTENIYPFFSPGLNEEGENSAPLVISDLAESRS